jgi:DNA-binding MarR family transcriptional regulator
MTLPPDDHAAEAATNGNAAATNGETGRGNRDIQQSIAIDLDDGQINQVLRAASETGHISARLAKLVDGSLAIDRSLQQFDDKHLSRSLMLGLLTYAAFPEDGSTLGVAELSRRLDTNVSTVHRYTTTLVAAGLLERDPGSRRYRLARVDREAPEHP